MNRTLFAAASGVLLLVAFSFPLTGFAQAPPQAPPIGTPAPVATGGGQRDPNAPDVSDAPTAAAVLKGKVPVSKDLLRVSLPRPQSFLLKNGARVLVLEDHRSPTVDISLYVRAGTLYAENPALANITASILDEGTTNRTGQQIAEESQDLGARLSVGASSEWATLGAGGLSESTDKLLDLMADVLLHPAFPEDRLRRFKAMSAVGLAQGRTNPAQIVALIENRVLYGGTPYARVQPSREQIAAIGKPEVEAFWRERWRPNGALIAVSGDVNAKKVVAQLEKVLADWKPGTDAPPLPSASAIAPKNETRIFLVDRPGSQQTALEFGNIGISRKDPDYYALVVANRILGGGSSARLFVNLRQAKGYTYGAYSRISTPANRPGVWAASANVRTPVTGPAAQEFVKEFLRLQDEPVSEAELARAKRAIVGAFARTLESPDLVLGRTVELVQEGLPSDYWETYPARIDAVTAADVQRVARRILGKGKVQLFAVGERSAIEPALSALGPITLYDTQGNPVQ